MKISEIRESKIVEENGNKTTEVKESKTTELRDNKSSGKNRFKTEEYEEDHTEKDKKGIWGILVTVLAYIILLVFTAVNIDDSDIATLLIPVVFYVIVNIILRNSIQNDETKRLKDLNDFALVGYAITYLILTKLEVFCWFQNVFNIPEINLTILDIIIFTIMFFLLGILIIIAIFILVLPWLSKKRNKDNSHYK
ncbi:hypothetical protein SEB_p202458 (plasmid) [Staphylococcus epidermidis PM221]|uniref:hypothetical protein n=1 Tax=Staphylococcus epidermidis TaxID=1282 RepID=UPI0004E5F2BB|nr:hypothetical protein [Staphylococcus epidermidis]CDM14992.1 hypothetical protein SEB_p202458 [Staphylococcus epidermidis PM221]